MSKRKKYEDNAGHKITRSVPRQKRCFSSSGGGFFILYVEIFDSYCPTIAVVSLLYFSQQPVRYQLGSHRRTSSTCLVLFTSRLERTRLEAPPESRTRVQFAPGIGSARDAKSLESTCTAHCRFVCCLFLEVLSPVAGLVLLTVFFGRLRVCGGCWFNKWLMEVAVRRCDGWKGYRSSRQDYRAAKRIESARVL